MLHRRFHLTEMMFQSMSGQKPSKLPEDLPAKVIMKASIKRAKKLNKPKRIEITPPTTK